MENYIGKTIQGKAASSVDGVQILITAVAPDEVRGRVAASDKLSVPVGLEVYWTLPGSPEERIAFQETFTSLWEVA